jgi:hypothetical protein
LPPVGQAFLPVILTRDEKIRCGLSGTEIDRQECPSYGEGQNPISPCKPPESRRAECASDNIYYVSDTFLNYRDKAYEDGLPSIIMKVVRILFAISCFALLVFVVAVCLHEYLYSFDPYHSGRFRGLRMI